MSSMYGHIHSASPNPNWSVIETFTKTLSSCSDADCFTLFGRIASSGSAGNPYLDGTGLKEKDSDKWPIDFLKQSSSIIHYELQGFDYELLLSAMSRLLMSWTSRKLYFSIRLALRWGAHTQNIQKMQKTCCPTMGHCQPNWYSPRPCCSTDITHACPKRYCSCTMVHWMCSNMRFNWTRWKVKQTSK